MSKELRFAISSPQVETREAGGKSSTRITGYGAVFYNGDENTQFRLWDGAVERIDKGAFKRALKDCDDCRALFNHDPNRVLGRVSAGTLNLSVDATGLRYEILPPDTDTGREVMELVKRGDLQGSSFSFQIEQEEWVKGKDGAPDVRNIKQVRLYDVGPVTFPAYEGTTTQARSSWEASILMQQKQAVQEALEKLDRDGHLS